MRKIFLSLLVVFSLFYITGCNNKDEIKDNLELQIEEKKESDIMTNINVIINNNSYVLKLEENETVRELFKLLPQEYTMNELNGNEKYVYLGSALPTNSSKPKKINKGDVMLFGDNCLVVFYESFNTNYSYTKIGHIDDLPNLGNSNITIRFEK